METFLHCYSECDLLAAPRAVIDEAAEAFMTAHPLIHTRNSTSVITWMSLPAPWRARLLLGHPPVGNLPNACRPMIPREMSADQWSQHLVRVTTPLLRALLQRRDLLDEGIPGPLYKGDAGSACPTRRRK